MSERFADPRALNVRHCCVEGDRLEGRWPLNDLSRLESSLFAASGLDDTVAWSAQGSQVHEHGAEPQLWLRLQAQTAVTLQCQRCLQPLVQPLEVDRSFRFVRTEEEAERLDEQSEDDVLVLAARLDLLELLEDELILSLPLVPRHEGDCPVPLPLPAADLPEEDPAPNPFAALAALRGRDGSQ